MKINTKRRQPPHDSSNPNPAPTGHNSKRASRPVLSHPQGCQRSAGKRASFTPAANAKMIVLTANLRWAGPKATWRKARAFGVVATTASRRQSRARPINPWTQHKSSVVVSRTHHLAAIEAHAWALRQWQSTKAAEDRPLADLTLHAIILCRLPEICEAQAVIDYLTDLPAEAWPEHPEQSGEAFWEATLYYFRRVIGWRQAG